MNIRDLGRDVPYLSTWKAMQDFTERRDADTEDEIWLLEHEPVYTQGVGGKDEHVLRPNAIPIVRIDRGGQITYHGPGQLTLYVLWDLKRFHLGIRDLVSLLEQSVIRFLADYGLHAEALRHAPGVYIQGQKIASLGLKVRHGCCYHGLALNVNMDLQPFRDINPCGLAGMSMTQLAHYGIDLTVAEVGQQLSAIMIDALNARLELNKNSL